MHVLAAHKLNHCFGRRVGLLVARLVSSGFWVSIRLEYMAGWTALKGQFRVSACACSLACSDPLRALRVCAAA